MDAADWIEGISNEDLGITATTTDAELAALAEKIRDKAYACIAFGENDLECALEHRREKEQEYAITPGFTTTFFDQKIKPPNGRRNNMKTKNLFAIIIIFALTLGIAPVAMATNVQIGDQVITLPADQQPIITETNIPVRATFEALGYDVSYDDQLCFLVLTSPDATVFFPLGARGYVINGGLMAAFSPLLIQDNTLYIDIKDAGWIIGSGANYVPIYLTTF